MPNEKKINGQTEKLIEDIAKLQFKIWSDSMLDAVRNWDDLHPEGRENFRDHAREIIALMSFDEIRVCGERSSSVVTKLWKDNIISATKHSQIVYDIRNILSLIPAEPKLDEPDSKRECVKGVVSKDWSGYGFNGDDIHAGMNDLSQIIDHIDDRLKYIESKLEQSNEI